MTEDTGLAPRATVTASVAAIALVVGLLVGALAYALIGPYRAVIDTEVQVAAIGLIGTLLGTIFGTVLATFIASRSSAAVAVQAAEDAEASRVQARDIANADRDQARELALAEREFRLLTDRAASTVATRLAKFEQFHRAVERHEREVRAQVLRREEVAKLGAAGIDTSTGAAPAESIPEVRQKTDEIGTIAFELQFLASESTAIIALDLYEMHVALDKYVYDHQKHRLPTGVVALTSEERFVFSDLEMRAYLERINYMNAVRVELGQKPLSSEAVIGLVGHPR